MEPEEDDDLDKLRHLELKESEGSILLVRTGQGERLVKETMDDPIGKIYREPIRIK